ncbi:unnamed protein product [Caenorhabditis bovis]|uniref:DUF19 domain-containing protein n=1 Tax=Caenorhabditis bovis TaxID=2654633 RepID=A0A8S1ECW5_9PELO|nr:unnamed protein product [Caenorhabditis bovis]
MHIAPISKGPLYYSNELKDLYDFALNCAATKESCRGSLGHFGIGFWHNRQCEGFYDRISSCASKSWHHFQFAQIC